MKHLVELLDDKERIGEREAIVYFDGYRSYRWSYRQLLRQTSGLAGMFERRGITRGDRVLLWGENRPGWVVAFWACLSQAVTVVPIDSRFSKSLVARIQDEVRAKILIHGNEVDAARFSIDKLTLENIERDRFSLRAEPVSIAPDDIVQILYTSGTTGQPKGVVHRHHHLCTNLEPIREEIVKYDRYARWFQPIRFLNLLPLSHIFGQVTGLYVPLAIGGSVVFLKEIHPQAIIDTIRRERVAVLVTVPRFLQQIRRELERRFALPRETASAPGVRGGLKRWWRHRDLHFRLGWKFAAILSGGSRLSRSEEEFWWRAGFVLVQGYGLTEAGSLVSTNHPFHTRRGSLGKPVGSQDIRLADDGEILIRGANVSHEYFHPDSQVEPPSFEGNHDEVWLHTGDLGELDSEGHLYFRGRKKDVIIGADGLNVHPVDVESVLSQQPEVRDAVVIGRPSERGETVHAVLLLDASAGRVDVSELLSRVNRKLEPHQRIRSHSLWAAKEFPRTPSTFKIRRHEIAATIERELSMAQSERTGRSERDKKAAPDTEPLTADALAARELVAQQLGRSPATLSRDAELSSELGLTSLDRIELLTRIEHQLGTELSESEMKNVETVADLEKWLTTAKTEPTATSVQNEAGSPLSGLVRISRATPMRMLRGAFRESVVLPLFRRYLPLTIGGIEHLPDPPVIFAANHTSNLDTLAVLAALPFAMRKRLAPAVWQEYFSAYFDHTGSFFQQAKAALKYWLAVTSLNVFPLPQTSSGARASLRFAARLLDEGYCVLIFPEGRRSPDGELHEFKPGVGMMAARLRSPVVPVHIGGLFQVLSVHDRWPKAGPVEIRFGAPLTFAESADFRRTSETIERAVRRLGAGGPPEGSTDDPVRGE